MRFDELPLCEEVQHGLEAMNFTEATPVQAETIPVILAKRDVIACAQTGTGKTAAFILPLLHNLQSEPHVENKVNAIIMAPTRELAQQIDQQMEGFSYFTSFSSFWHPSRVRMNFNLHPEVYAMLRPPATI